MAEHKIHRHEVDLREAKCIKVSGPVTKVAPMDDSLSVEFWTLEGEWEPEEVRFKIIGTGSAWDTSAWEYVGTANRNSEGLVWHLLAEVVPAEENLVY